MQERRHRPATAKDFHRLCALAHERGLRLFRDGPRWYCTSASRPGESYFLTGYSCTCPGFLAHQRCSHHALLLERLGWLPELEEIVAGATITGEERFAKPSQSDCAACSGCGVVVYRSFEERCTTCGGSGIKPDHRLAGAPVIQPVATIAA
jgi:hypothetical protein